MSFHAFSYSIVVSFTHSGDLLLPLHDTIQAVEARISAVYLHRDSRALGLSALRYQYNSAIRCQAR